ncbi:uncharacterized protein LOC100891405 [Strongylocentrotus purpuratus]|uniref:Uncharacterized protein n=1 Tax=Strongylocentrotus purpuratus TaxID=7668 RepID=A0A7M7SZB6_STRPU|nr:uncharacterized protein LOC100891405 [Strongylocentrotus purpuratus]
MGKKRIHRKPVALTFADTSNQPTEQDGEGCSSWNPGQRERNQRDGKESSAQQRHKNGDEDEIECMGMVSSSTASTENHRNSRPSNRELVRRQQEEEEQRIKKQEEEEFQRALELSRQETQVTSVTNSTSDGIISNDEIEGGDRVQTNNGVGGGESDGNSSGLEDVGLGIHGEAQAQAQTSGRRDASHKNSRMDGAGSSDGEDSDVTDISNEENERGVAAEASGHVEDDVEDEEGNGDDDDSSVGSSILLQSDEEVDKISSQEITAGQPPHASSSCPTQSSEKAVAKVGPLEDRNAVTPDGSIDIFDVTEDQEELSQELYVDNQRPGDQEGSIDIFDVMEDQDELAQELDSQRSHQGYEPQPESTHSQEEDRGGSSNMDLRRTRLSLRKRKRNGEEGSELRTNSNKTKAPRLAQESESEGSEVDVEVGAGDEDEDSSAPPSQDAGFIDFPERFSDNAGVPLVDPRKPNHKSPFLAPDGVLPNAYTAVILRLFYQYKMRLLKAQAKQKHRLALGKPVVVGPHVKDTIVHKKRGQKVFQWLLSSDEESAGNSQENDPEVANQARLVKPLRTDLGHLSKVFQNNTDVNKVRIVPGNQQAEARPAGFKPKLEWTRSVSGSSGVQNNARTTGFLSLRTADEVSSSRTLVSKVSPVQKRAVGEWTSKSEMTRKREAKRRSSSSDESDADVEVVPVNTTTRTPLTATVSPRRSTPPESQSSSSLRSPVFGGKSSRGLVRPSSGVPRQVGHCSPRTLQNNRDKMESPQPSSPRLRVDNDARTHATIAAESASGVSSTVPDNGGRHAMSRVDQHQEATASGTVSSGMPTSRTGADSAADQSRACSTSTNHAESGVNSDTVSASSKLASSSIYGPAHSFEEERLDYYKLNRLGVTRQEENGIGDVGSSNVNRLDESNNGESEEGETVAQENSSSHKRNQINGAVDNSGRDVVDRLAPRNYQNRGENESRKEDEHNDNQADEEAEIQNSNEAAVSIGTDSPIAEMDDNILDEGGGPSDEDLGENVEPARRDEDHQAEEEEVHEGGGGDEVEADGVQCPLCGVTFAMTIIEVHAAECNGPVENAEPARPEPVRRPRPGPAPTPRPPSPRDRIVARMEMLDRTSSEDEGDDGGDDDDDVIVSGEAQEAIKRPGRKQNVRKRTFPSSENTSDSPTSSVGSMSHFDNVVMNMVRRNEIKVTAPGPSSSSSSKQPDRNHPAPKRGKWQSKTTSSHAADSDGDDDDEPGEVEKCFICNKFISKSLYQAHVQNELDRMDASNNSQVESTSSPSKNTRQSIALGSENNDAVPSAVSTSTSSSTRRQILSTAAAEGSSTGGVSRSRSGNAAAQGTRAKRAVNAKGGEATSTSQLRSKRKRDISSEEEEERSGPNSPSALDEFLVDSDDDDDDNYDIDDDSDGDDRVRRDPSSVPFSDSPIKAFKSLKHNPPCLIDFKNQFNTSGREKSPRKFTGRGAGGKGSGRGRGKGKGKWKSGKKWGRGGKSRK